MVRYFGGDQQMALLLLGMLAAESGHCFVGTGLKPIARSAGRSPHATMPYLDFGESSAERIDHLSEEINRLRKEMAKHRRIHAEFEASVEKLEKRVLALEDSDELNSMPSALRDVWTSVKELDRQVDAIDKELDVEARILDAARDTSLVDGMLPKASYSINSEDAHLRVFRTGATIDAVDKTSSAPKTRGADQDEPFRLGGDPELLPLEKIDGKAVASDHAGVAPMRIPSLLDYRSTHREEATILKPVGLEIDQNDAKEDVAGLVMLQEEDAAKASQVTTALMRDASIKDLTGAIRMASASEKAVHRHESDVIAWVEGDPSLEDRKKEFHEASCPHGHCLEESATGLVQSAKREAVATPSGITDATVKSSTLSSLVSLLKSKANFNKGNTRSREDVASTSLPVEDVDTSASASLRASAFVDVTSDYLLSIERTTRSQPGSMQSYIDYGFASKISTLSASKESPTDYLSTLVGKTFVLTPRSYAGADFLELKSEASLRAASNTTSRRTLSTLGFSREASRYRTHVLKKGKRKKVRRETKGMSSDGLSFGSSDFFAALSSRSPEDRDRAAMISILLHRARYYMTRKQIIPMVPTAPLRSDSTLTRAGNSSTPIILQRRTRRTRPKEDR